MDLVLYIVYNSIELTLADIQRALALSKPSHELCPSSKAISYLYDTSLSHSGGHASECHAAVLQ